MKMKAVLRDCKDNFMNSKSELMTWTMLKPEMCEQAKANIEGFQLKAKVEKEFVKKDAEIQAKLYSVVKELNEKAKKMKDNDTTVHAQEDRLPEAARNALRYTTSARVCRYIKIGCALVFDSVAAYALFTITKPFFF